MTDRTGMRMGGVLPMVAHELPDEEGATIRATPLSGDTTVGIVRYPYASNLDEFHLVGHAAHVRWILRPSDMEGCDLVVLPGSKHVAADTGWLRDRGLDRSLIARAAAGGPTIGICGGCMMLGERVSDHGMVEGATTGLGLLPMHTEMESLKVTRAVSVTFPVMGPPWSALSGLSAPGFEIRNGQVSGERCGLAPLVWGRGAVLATTVHGLLESPEVLEALCGQRPPPVLDSTFDALADAVDEHLDTGLLWELVSRSRTA